MQYQLGTAPVGFSPVHPSHGRRRDSGAGGKIFGHVVRSRATSEAASGLNLTRAPEEFTSAAGQLTNVNRVSPTSSNDIYKCAGCVDPACSGAFGCAGYPWRLETGGYLREILMSKVYDVAIETPMDRAQGLSAKYDCNFLLKREDLQPVKSFKLRGAYNKMAQLTREQLDKGVICSSAGNHAQGVALSAARLGAKATIAMPLNTPEIKVNAVRALGGNVELVGESYQETQAYAQAKSQSDGIPFIAPYDDPYTIAGQGTIGAEILRQCDFDDLEAVFVPVGGGGLIAGVAAYIKSVCPKVKVIGVEPAGANAMAQSLAIGERVTLSRVDTFADGVAVKQVGQETFRLCRELVDGVILVSNAATSAAIKDVFNESRSLLEPSGAIAVAGAKDYVAKYGAKGKAVVAITSGANMNFDRLRQVSDLAGVGEAEATLAVKLPEEDGSFANMLGVAMDGQTFDVTELKYRYSAGCEGSLLFGVSLSPKSDEFKALSNRLDQSGYQAMNLSDVEIAQVHLRHLVGGHSNTSSALSALDTITEDSDVAQRTEVERIFLVDFPERPGALQSFLPHVSPRFGITLFHYRRTGNRSSGVLLGLRAAGADADKLDAAIAELNASNEFSVTEISEEERRLFRFFLR